MQPKLTITDESTGLNTISKDELDFHSIINLLLRRRWFLIGFFGVSVIIVALFTIRLPRIYKASATVLIERNAPQVLSKVREVYDLGANGYWSAREYYNTQYDVIRSTPVVKKAAIALGLVPDTIVNQVQAVPESVESLASKDFFRELPEGIKTKLRLLGISNVSSKKDIIESLIKIKPENFIRSKIQVEPVKDSQLVNIVILDTNPRLSALLANMVANSYIEYNLEQKTDTTRSAVNWLSDQKEESKQKLNDSEVALHNFKQENNIVSVSMEVRQTLTAETLSQLNYSLSEIRAKKLALESKRNYAKKVTSDSLVGELLDETITNRLIQQLKTTYSNLKQQESELSLKYTSEHPKLTSVNEKLVRVSKDIKNEIEKIYRALEHEYKIALETEQRLKIAINEVKAEALALNKKEIDYNKLKRERDNNLELYNLLLKRQKEADLSQLLKVNNVRVLELAQIPNNPIKPKVMLNILIAIVVGLMGGVGLAFFVDFIDNTIKSQLEIENIGLPFLGIIPAIRGAKGAKLIEATDRDQFLISHPRSSVAECSRSIRTNLMFMSPENPARLILVTSSNPKEGKTTTVVNLAITMAQAGARVIVIDTDMRRPRIHKSFGIGNEQGVTNLIMGDIDLDEVINPTCIDKLDVISCGPIPPNPAELLHTEGFQNVIRELSEKYDRIILDSPPVAAVSDALVLSSMVDGVVLVVQAGKTTLQGLSQAKSRLEDVGGKIFGVVLNDVDLENKRSYNYYQYYYYYRSGYGYGEENKSQKKKVV